MSPTTFVDINVGCRTEQAEQIAADARAALERKRKAEAEAAEAERQNAKNKEPELTEDQIRELEQRRLEEARREEEEQKKRVCVAFVAGARLVFDKCCAVLCAGFEHGAMKPTSRNYHTQAEQLRQERLQAAAAGLYSSCVVLSVCVPLDACLLLHRGHGKYRFFRLYVRACCCCQLVVVVLSFLFKPTVKVFLNEPPVAIILLLFFSKFSYFLLARCELRIVPAVCAVCSR